MEHSSETFSKNVLAEELRQRRRLSVLLKSEINSIYDEIRQTCSFFHYTCILRTMTKLCWISTPGKYHDYYQDRNTLANTSLTPLIFQKLVLCRGLNFAIPGRVSSIDMKASFEKAYWKLEPRLPEEFRDLAASTLRSVALNYIHRKGPKPPQTLLKSHSSVEEVR